MPAINYKLTYKLAYMCKKLNPKTKTKMLEKNINFESVE